MTTDCAGPRDGGSNGIRPLVIVGLVALYGLLAVVSWRRSGDLLIDWGRELYTAWRLSEGDVLYRDVASLFGPLASYLNASLFWVFGPSIGVLQAANTVGIGLLSILLYDVFRRMSGHTGGALATFLFLCVFAFAYMTEAGLYNFATPYAHDATVGLGLCVVLVWMLIQIERSPTPLKGLGAGLACGLAWLTKPEIAVGAAVTLGAGAILLTRRSPRLGARVWLAMLLGVLLPSVLVTLAFLAPLGPERALAIPGEAFRSALAAEVWDMPFYRAVSGLGRPWHNLTIVSVSAFSFATVLTGLELLERRLHGRARQVTGMVLLTGGAVSMVVLHDEIPWLEAARPLPVLTAGLCVFTLVRAWALHDGTRADESRLGLACWSVLSLALLWKVVLLARFYHFGFYLTLPATLLVGVVLVYHLPRWLPATSGQFVKSFSIVVIGAFAATALGIELRQYRARSFEVGPARDRMRVFQPFIDPRAVTVAETLDFLSSRTEEFSTVLVLPEGAMLNFWLRRPTPTPHLSLMPPEMARYGEETVRQTLLENPPDMIVLADRRLVDYGAKEFSMTTFGESLVRWIQTDYCLLNRVHARARDYETGVATRSVAHPSHYIEVFGRKGSRLCTLRTSHPRG